MKYFFKSPKTIAISLLALSYSLASFSYETIAHRGSSKGAPENTIAAIKLAEKEKADYIEIDVHLTKDGHVVAIHDKSVDRTTNGSGKVQDFTLEQLQQLDAGSWFSPNFKGAKVPSLKEVFQSISENTRLIIELKYGDNKYPGIEKKIVKMVKDFNLENRVILKSFDVKILNTFEEIEPSIPRLYVLFGSWGGFTIDNFIRFHSMISIQNVSYYQVHKFFISQSLVDQVHREGKEIIAWGVTLNDREQMQELGVDILEVDDPENF